MSYKLSKPKPLAGIDKDAGRMAVRGLQQGLLIIRRLLLLGDLVRRPDYRMVDWRHVRVWIGRHIHGHACMVCVRSLVHVLRVHPTVRKNKHKEENLG